MIEADLSKVLVGIICDDDDQLHIIQSAFQGLNIPIKISCTPGKLQDSTFFCGPIHLWIVDLVDHDKWDVFLDEFIDSSSATFIFGDGNAPTIASTKFRRWQKRLQEKIIYLIKIGALTFEDEAFVARSKESKTHYLEERRGKVKKEGTTFSLLDVESEYASRVWVIGASLGGPSAVKEFLDALEPDLPIAFILAQHIDLGFQALLGQVLGRNNYFELLKDFRHIRLKQGQILIAPADSSIQMDSKAFIIRTEEPWRKPYSPCIDQVMEVVAKRFKEKSGAIIFSGMGNDSSAAAKMMHDSGGKLWAQSEDSCINSSQPDSIRETGLVTFNGTPQQLAMKMNDELRSEKQNNDEELIF